MQQLRKREVQELHRQFKNKEDAASYAYWEKEPRVWSRRLNRERWRKDCSKQRQAQFEAEMEKAAATVAPEPTSADTASRLDDVSDKRYAFKNSRLYTRIAPRAAN